MDNYKNLEEANLEIIRLRKLLSDSYLDYQNVIKKYYQSGRAAPSTNVKDLVINFTGSDAGGVVVSSEDVNIQIS